MRRIENILIAAGLACLAAFAWQLLEREWFQRSALRELAASRQAPAAPVPRNGLLGRIEIPRLRLSAAILEGANSRSLHRAVGHVPGTAYPGETGRIGLAAHRDSFFRNLRDLRTGDTIRLVTSRGVKEFRVASTAIVKPDQTSVLAPSAGSVVTLVTCYPFDYLGNAPYRFIVNATAEDDRPGA